MIYKQEISAHTINKRGKICGVEFCFLIDYDSLTLSGLDLKGEFEESFDEFSQLEEAYQKRAQAIFNSQEIQDPDCIEGGPIQDLLAYQKEIHSAGLDQVEEVLDLEDELEQSIAAACTEIRRELNRALGKRAIEVENIVLCVDDSRIYLAYINPPKLAGLSKADIEKIEDKFSWYQGEASNYKKLKLPISHERLFFAPEDWIENNFSYEFLSAALNLITARLANKPKLRANVEIKNPLGIFYALHGELWFSVKDDNLAKDFVNQAASKYFAYCYEKLVSKS